MLDTKIEPIERFYESFDEKNDVGNVSGGELFEKVVDEDFCLTEKDCQNYVRQICLALQYLHTHSIIHLDLKPENIMCVHNSAHKIKVIDFGLAQRYNPGKKIKVLFGTPEFMAPEVVNYEDIDLNTDMWSLGVVAYVLLSGLSPFMGESTGETLSSITKAEFDFDDEEFDEVSNEARDFISKLLVKNKSKRMTSTQALDHPWLNPTPEKRKLRRINTKRHQKYLVHHRWQQAIGAIKTINILNLKDRENRSLNRRGSALMKSSKSEISLNTLKPLITPKYSPLPLNKKPSITPKVQPPSSIQIFMPSPKPISSNASSNNYVLNKDKSPPNSNNAKTIDNKPLPNSSTFPKTTRHVEFEKQNTKPNQSFFNTQNAKSSSEITINPLPSSFDYNKRNTLTGTTIDLNSSDSKRKKESVTNTPNQEYKGNTPRNHHSMAENFFKPISNLRRMFTHAKHDGRTGKK
ncbi:myosin light chain kinase 3-like isoform X2 [Gordionus sp. m RMFG-2023]|uniref:myosin light chain kinase 3-like isoform X2 n=1 Tax=Gordionus sp. m RMFG-2023 TaxID=3053472 RepID=UPI0031FD56DB